MARMLLSLLLVALLGVQVVDGSNTVNTRIPMITWGQDENSLFVSAAIPTPIDVNDVSFNDSHVKIDVLATDKEIPYFVEFELREDILAKKSSWLVTRTGVKLVLKKAVPHRFDRLLADTNAVPKHLIRVDWDEYMEEEDPIEQSKYPGSRVKLFSNSEDLEDEIDDKGTVVAWLNYDWCQKGVMKRWDFGELSVRVPNVSFVQVDVLKAKDLARKYKIECEFENFMLIFQKGERLSPYKYRMFHNKSVAEATVKAYTAPALTFLPEATWREDVQRILANQTVPMPIAVAHFNKWAPELEAVMEAAMQLRGRFTFYVAPPAAGEPRLRVYKTDDPDETVSDMADDEAITAASVVQFVRSRALPLLAKYIQEQRFRYVEAGIPVGQVFIWEDPEGYAEYVNKTRSTVLAIARALRGKVAFYEVDDLGGSDMKEYGLAQYVRPALGIVTHLNEWGSPRFGFYDKDAMPAVSPGGEEEVVAWANDVLAGKVERDRRSNPVPSPHEGEPIQEVVARNWKKRVLLERKFSLMLTYHLGMQERGDYDKTKETLRRTSIALNTTAPGVALVCQYATNENYVHLYPNGTDWYQAPEQPREVGVYFFKGTPKDFVGVRLTQKNVLQYGVLYVLRRVHELSGGVFDLEAAKAAIPPKERVVKRVAEDGTEEVEGEDEVEGPGGAAEPDKDAEEEGSSGGAAEAKAGIEGAAGAAKQATEAAEEAKKEAEEIGRKVKEAKEKIEAAAAAAHTEL